MEPTYFDESTNESPRRTVTGVLLVTIGLLLHTIALSGTVPYTLAHPSVEAMVSGGTPMWISVLGCLAPIATLLNLIGFFFIASDAKKISPEHNRLAWLGAILLVLSIVPTLVITLPLSFSISRSGSIQLAVLSTWASGIGSALGSLAFALPVYHLAGPTISKIGAGIAGLIAVGELGQIFVNTSDFKMYDMSMMGQTVYIPSPYMGGLYPVLAIATLVLFWAIFIIYLISFFRTRQLVQSISEVVVV